MNRFKIFFNVDFILLLFLSSCGGGQSSTSVTMTVTYRLSPVVPTVSPTASITITPTPTPTLQPIEMVMISKGEFTMGSDDGLPNAQPAHQVFLEAYYIDKYEVTNSLYKTCEDAGICRKPSKTDHYNDPEYDQHPVVFVSWGSAKTFCEWRGARLPTEAEWEKAARGTNRLAYPWGDDFNGSIVNFCDINCSMYFADQESNDGYAETSPVGSYPNGVSSYGAYDMAGNVWEWVADWYDENYYADSPYSNPTGPDNGEFRVLRGGSWFNTMKSQLSFTRNYEDPVPSHAHTTGIYGFRCALSP